MGKRISLLYAEDSPDWAQTIKEILEPADFDVRIAQDGNEAWIMFQTEKPDIVLLDIDMPGRNGWELIRDLKKEKEGIPIVLYSAFYDSKKLTEAFGIGAEDFLSKVCVPDELINRLRAFYYRAVTSSEDFITVRISNRIIFNIENGVLEVDGNKEILRYNETRLLHTLYLKINQKSSKEHLCESIWGKGMYCDIKCNALKICITNLRKYLIADPSVKIINIRSEGYSLINTYNKN